MPTLACHLPLYCWHLLLLCLYVERMLLTWIAREWFSCWRRGTGSPFICHPSCLPCLMAIWCLLGLVMKPMCFQGEEILSKPLNIPWALIGKRCHRRWEGVGVTQQRESITKDGKACFHKVSVLSAILLSLCLWNSPSSAQWGNSFHV